MIRKVHSRRELLLPMNPFSELRRLEGEHFVGLFHREGWRERNHDVPAQETYLVLSIDFLMP